MAGESDPPLFQRIAFIGCGLIGSSLARVVRRDRLAGHVAVAARTQRTLDKVVELGLADTTTLEPAAAVEGADMVMVCAPPGSYGKIASDMAPALAPGCTVSDVGSVKRVAFRELAPHLPDGVQLGRRSRGHHGHDADPAEETPRAGRTGQGG